MVKFSLDDDGRFEYIATKDEHEAITEATIVFCKFIEKVATNKLVSPSFAMLQIANHFKIDVDEFAKTYKAYMKECNHD